MTESHAEGATTDTVALVGLGYVGLPLAVEFDRAGLAVVAYDVDGSKVEALRAGRDPTGDVGEEAVAAGDVRYTTDPVELGDADYVIVTVPTPVDDTGVPDLSYVESAGETVGRNLSPGTIVVLESTVFPGATRQVLVPAVERTSGFTEGEEFAVGYSPERASPGETGRSVRDVVKIVGARDEAVREDLAALYGRVVDAGIYRAADVPTAEAAKVLENVQRDLNIALVNEFAIACKHLDLDTESVLEAAETKWNFHGGYRPGLVGGHCIPVDPLYLTYESERNGFSPKLILQGREINEYVPHHAAERALRGLNRCGRVLKESRMLVLGLAYKPNVGDVRTSEVDTVIEELRSYGVSVVGYDPHVPADRAREAFDVEVQETLSFAGFDGVVVATGHDEFDALALETVVEDLNDDPVVMDLSGTFDPERAEEHDVAYERL
ncbi:MAG: nucleotide sugar dehydrogenase [Haloarculaceae archaeon]